MTNSGHVDPGYAGPMRFTVINMGSQDYILGQGDEIMAMLLIELSSSAHRDWLMRHGGNPAGPPTQDDSDRLSADFLDIDRRVTESDGSLIVIHQDSTAGKNKFSPPHVLF
jgi:dCTP deaminase